MSWEIEHKFLVTDNRYKERAYKSIEIKQGLISYLGNEVRVSIRGDRAWVCIKSLNTSLKRFEWNKEISVSEAEELLKNCCVSNIISKTRYFVMAPDNFLWEIDEFHDSPEGLTIAEVEVPDENCHPDLFPWIGEEVTGNKNYYNSVLSLC